MEQTHDEITQNLALGLRWEVARRDFPANPIKAVVVRKWQGKDYGPGGKTVFLTNASVAKPLQPFDDYDERSPIQNCCIKEAKPQWDLGHPPQKNPRDLLAKDGLPVRG
jgi:hypothetical protein